MWRDVEDGAASDSAFGAHSACPLGESVAVYGTVVGGAIICLVA
jgi:hypothetical protein